MNLDFASVKSPIDGIVGVARAQIGDLVGPGSGNLTEVSTLDPIKAYITVSEQYYLEPSGHFVKRDQHQATLGLELELGPGERNGLSAQRHILFPEPPSRAGGTGAIQSGGPVSQS